jgi:hypothetical protein
VLRRKGKNAKKTKKSRKTSKQANKHIMEDEKDFDFENETDSED